jgi:hypothetical protein
MLRLSADYNTGEQEPPASAQPRAPESARSTVTVRMLVQTQRQRVMLMVRVPALGAQQAH